jgi:hypothetical protein
VIDLVAMVGLLAPVVWQQERTTTQVASSPVTPLALAQGIVPLVCLGFMLLLGRLAPLRPTATELWLGGFLGVPRLARCGRWRRASAS